MFILNYKLTGSGYYTKGHYKCTTCCCNATPHERADTLHLLHTGAVGCETSSSLLMLLLLLSSTSWFHCGRARALLELLHLMCTRALRLPPHHRAKYTCEIIIIMAGSRAPAPECQARQNSTRAALACSAMCCNSCLRPWGVRSREIVRVLYVCVI